MKLIKVYIIVVTLLLTSCSQQQESSVTPVVPKDDVVALVLSAKDKKIILKSDDAPLPQSITTGVYVVVKGSPVSTSQWLNYKHTADASGALLSDLPINLLQTKSYDIYAYSPYQSGIGNTTSILFDHGVDVLWAPKFTLDYVTATNKTGYLNFNHCMSQISFNVVLADDIKERDFTAASSIEVSGFYDKGILNIESGSFTPTGTKNIVLKGLGIGNPGSMTLGIGSTCFVPSSEPMTFTVNVLFKDIDYTATITDSFVPGHSYVYTVTVKSSDLQLGVKGQLIDWTEVKDGFAIV